MPASVAWKDLAALVATADNPFPGADEMGSAVLEFDWASTSVGPVSFWSQSLLSYTRVMLTSKQPICFFWGPELLMFFNQAYKPMLGQRAEVALGHSFATVWPDVWADVLPMTRSALSGTGVKVDEMPMTMTRHGYPEQTFWTFAYTPLWNDDGRIAGLINTPVDVTSAVKAFALDPRKLRDVTQSTDACRCSPDLEDH